MGLAYIVRTPLPSNYANLLELASKQSKAIALCDNYQLVKGVNFTFTFPFHRLY